MARRRLLVVVGLALAMGAATSWAQEDDDEIDTAFRKLAPAEEQRLRQTLATPIPPLGPAMVNKKSASPESLLAPLNRHFQSKYLAARMLGDAAAVESVLSDAVRLLPDAHWRNKLGDVMLAKGQLHEGNAMNRQAVSIADPYLGALILANISCNQYQQHQDAAARAVVAEVADKVKRAEKDATTDAERSFLFRATARGAYCLSLVEQRQGHFVAAAKAAEVAEQSGRRALSLTSTLGPMVKLASGVGLALSMQRKVSAYRSAGRLQDAEKALADYLRLSSEWQLPANYLAGIYATAGGVRFDQREFAQSEQFYRKADRVMEGLGLERLHTTRTNYAREIVAALAGQRKWQAALAELEQLDQLAGTDRRLQGRVRFSFNRGLVYFAGGRFTDAASLFGQVARTQREQYGATHFLTAQATGLQGAALWRSAEPGNQVRAVPLLKAAVRDYMAPANADYLENIGLRKELRDFVFSAYLEAMALTAGEDAATTIGAADWVRGGLVQEAVSDAALRAAAGTSALADLVRREQDAKNEARELRRFLAGDRGATRMPLPEVAAQVRERIAVLETERVRLQGDIQARFPDYDRLVRPIPPSVADIVQQLHAQQALLMLLPTAEAVYVWAVAADRPARFARVPLDAGRLARLVATLRQQLEVGAGTLPAPAFDAAAAFELFERLLAPVAPAWQGKTQWIVAPGGVLSQLPFAVLHTRAGGRQGVDAPWLIKDAAITQVPSLSAWLSIKAMGGSRAASLPFAGWGDPAFGALAADTATISAEVTTSRQLAIRRVPPLADMDRPEATVNAPAALKYADIPPLPETRAELLAIASALQADPARDVLLGRQATRASVLEANQSGRLADRRVLAFATHGLMAGDLPNLTQPALAMAATGTEDQNPFAPLLTLEDVLTLKLNADWVVLSACNTAAADGKAEEALSGLARGFFYAGSRSLLVTHWAVESESAKQLTTSTFAHYAANPTAPKAESLRQAMLKVMAMPQFSHPAYWAPYALVGDGGR